MVVLAYAYNRYQAAFPLHGLGTRLTTTLSELMVVYCMILLSAVISTGLLQVICVDISTNSRFKGEM